MYSLKILTGHGEKFATIAPNRCIIIIIHFRYVRLNLIWCNSSWILKLSCNWHDHFINWLFSREISSNKNISYIYVFDTINFSNIPRQMEKEAQYNHITFDIWEPRLLCTPQHFKHTKTPILADLKKQFKKLICS
jgi:hypothetical protein